MKRLFDSGLRFYWLNVGSQANTVLTDKIKSQLRKNGLEDYFIFTGASKNPYSVMKRADAVCVLSDHESWSMVITEAKTLGTPVIATKTSGALEQIVDKENGVLCEFDDGDIAEKIREFLENTDIGESIRDNLRDFSSAKDALAQLDTVFTDKKKLLYVFDDINYMSGARTATLLQADSLRKSIKVDLFSVTAPKDENLISKYRVTDIEDNKKFKCLSVPTREVLSSKEYSKRVKLLRLIYAVRVRLGIDTPLYQRLLKNELTAQFNSYDFIIVVSEASKLRHFVATLKNPKKIQWIHTDYVEWQKHSPWTKKITSSDEKTYKKYDRVVCLSDSLCDKFSARYPSLKGRAVAIPNLIDYESIVEKSQSESDIQIDKSKLNLITIGRMEAEKRYESILKTAKELRDMGVDFAWYLVGDGDVLEEYKALSRELNVSDCVIFTGYLSNALPLLAQCDLFILNSEYEGTPVTIDEAKVLGVPVLSKNVGGIRDQLENGKYGQAVSELKADDIKNFNYTVCVKTNRQDFSKYNERVTDKLKSILK
jgi:glycosyltransferase involved in cell wall biosynthesis